ncbi:hypothetical protein D3C75_782400 [compost metagenome]
MPVVLQAILVAGDGELAAQGLGVHPDPHGGDLEAVLQHRVPHQDVAVQTGQAQFALAAPVVIVRGTHIVALAVGEGTADAYEENGSQLLGDGPLAPLGIEVRVTGQQLFAVQELDLGRQEGGQLVLGADRALCGLDGGPDAAHRLLQIGQIPALARHHLLPVPLIHVDGVDGGESVFVRAQGLHVGVDAFTRAEAKATQGMALPLGQGVHHLVAVFGECLHLHLHRILVAGEVVLSAITDPAQNGGLHLHQAQLLGELAGEHLFDEADLLLAANVVLFHGKYLFQTRWMWRFFNRLRTKFNIR